MEKKSTYSEKLKDPRWQKKRLSVLERDSWMCQKCGDGGSTLHVHHRIYSNKDPWDTDDVYLVTLCETCHQEETERMAGELQLLLAAVKKSFFVNDVTELTWAFERIKIVHSSDVTAATINYWISSEELMREMHDRFFEYLHKKNDGNPSV